MPTRNNLMDKVCYITIGIVNDILWNKKKKRTLKTILLVILMKQNNTDYIEINNHFLILNLV